MIEKARRERDAFSFSLGGMRTVSSFIAASAIAHDRLNKARDERLSQRPEDQPDSAGEITALKGRFWLSRRLRRAA